MKLLAQVVSSKDAVPLLRRVLAIEQERLGPADSQTLQDARTLANLLRAGGQIDEAAKLERQFKIAAGH
jgi:hypothetical protein